MNTEMLDSDSDEESSLLLETGLDNAEAFHTVWRGNVENFLKRDEYISVRGTAVSEEEGRTLLFRTDIDGVSIRWKDIGIGMSLEYTHLTFAPGEHLDIKPMYSVIKKHVNLCEYGDVGLANLKNTVGCQIMYYGGWETWLGFLPERSNTKHYTCKALRDITAGCIQRLHLELRKRLAELVEKGLGTDTLAKNNLENVGQLFVLPADRQLILSLFQDAVHSTGITLPGFIPLVYSFRFGEKCRTPVHLPILNHSGVEDICVHVGANVRSYSCDIFWCREGMNRLLGRRGQLMSTLSFFECVNFQSNLDGMEIDVKGKLLEICSFPENVRFVQLYSDIPHRRPRTVVHPVSASVILAEGIFYEKSARRVNGAALQYLSEVRNNFNQMREATCRIEFVVALPRISNIINANDLIDEKALAQLLIEEPMIVPFHYDVDYDVLKCVREVGLYLSEKLLTIYRTRRGTGNSDALWDAFQYECAVERLLWGNPFCRNSHTYSVNLGVGLAYPTRSLTDQMGFLCLEESSACCVDEHTLPPLATYTKNEAVQRQITRVVGLHNFIHSSSPVLGRRILMCLIKDLHEVGKVFSTFADFLLSLKRTAGNAGKRIVGAMSVKEVGEKLAGCRKCKWPMVFGTVKTLMGNDIEKLASVCVEGIHALELGYFPAVRFSDENRNEGMNWRFTYGLWVVTDEAGRGNGYEAEAASSHTLVLCELERRKLCHTSQYQTGVFPWLKPVLEKIASKKLKKEESLLVLTFVTCVALMMNGRFVEYLNLSRLERQLPLPQHALRMLEVQSKFRLGNVNTFALWRLHPSIPHKLCSPKTSTGPSVRERPVEQNTREYIREEDELVGMDTTETDAQTADHVQIVSSRHQPTSACCIGTFVWTPGELKILHEALQESCGPMAQRYRLYQAKCRQKGIPDRSRKAFLRKVSRLQSNI